MYRIILSLAYKRHCRDSIQPYHRERFFIIIRFAYCLLRSLLFQSIVIVKSTSKKHIVNRLPTIFNGFTKYTMFANNSGCISIAIIFLKK
jgi:hypothetical protein